MISKDCLCDSTFMLKVIRDIGKAIRKAFHWVDKNVQIYLIMDNAGGYDTKETKEEYTKILKEYFNVQLE